MALRKSALGAAVLMLVCALATAAAMAQSEGSLKQRPPGMDPWAAAPETVPAWDPRNAPPALQPRAKRHLEFLQAGTPVEYRAQRNPFPNTPGAIAEGGAVYAANCVACHGAHGRGDGEAGLDLVPSPALLSRLMDQQGAVDEYLLWTIAEGGKPFDTAMPAYKNRLTQDQVWQVISYMRAGFPQETP